MEELNSTPGQYNKKAYYTQAAIATVALGLLSVIPAYVNWIFNTQLFNGWLGTVYSIAVVFYILYYFGKKAAAIADPTTDNGYSYGRAFGFAIMVSLASAIIMTLFAWLLFNVVAPEMVQRLVDITMAKIEEMPTMTEQSVSLAMSSTRFFLSLPGLLITYLFSMGLTGGLIGLVTAAIVKRNPKM